MDPYAWADLLMAAVHLPYTLVYAYLAWQRYWTPPARALHAMLLCFWASGLIFHLVVALAGPDSLWRVYVLYARAALAAPLAIWAWPIVRYIAVLPMLPTLAEYERLSHESRLRDAAIVERNRLIDASLEELRKKAIEWGREHQFAQAEFEIRKTLHEVRNIIAVDRFAAAVRRLQEQARGHNVVFDRGALHDAFESRDEASTRPPVIPTPVQPPGDRPPGANPPDCPPDPRSPP